jgi:hypothetical protein
LYLLFKDSFQVSKTATLYFQMKLHSPILSAAISILLLAACSNCVVKADLVARNTNPTNVVDNVICQVTLTDFMRQSSDGVRGGGHAYDCLSVSGTGPHEIHLHFAANSLVRQENAMSLKNKGWYISFPLDWVSYDAQLLPHQTEQVTTLSLAEVDEALMLLQQERHGARNLQNGYLRKHRAASVDGETNDAHPRQLGGAFGARQCGIVIVHARDRANPATVASVEQATYITASNQFRACSNNAMSLNRKDATIFVTLPQGIGSYDANTVYEAARVAVCTYYRQPSNCEPATLRGLDHILYSIPYGTSDDTPGGSWAYAAVGDSRAFSIYNGNYFFPSTILHE